MPDLFVRLSVVGLNLIGYVTQPLWAISNFQPNKNRSEPYEKAECSETGPPFKSSISSSIYIYIRNLTYKMVHNSHFIQCIKAVYAVYDVPYGNLCWRGLFELVSIGPQWPQ